MKPVCSLRACCARREKKGLAPAKVVEKVAAGVSMYAPSTGLGEEGVVVRHRSCRQ